MRPPSNCTGNSYRSGRISDSKINRCDQLELKWTLICAHFKGSPSRFIHSALYSVGKQWQLLHDNGASMNTIIVADSAHIHRKDVSSSEFFLFLFVLFWLICIECLIFDWVYWVVYGERWNSHVQHEFITKNEEKGQDLISLYFFLRLFGH